MFLVTIRGARRSKRKRRSRKARTDLIRPRPGSGAPPLDRLAPLIAGQGGRLGEEGKEEEVYTQGGGWREDRKISSIGGEGGGGGTIGGKSN